MKLVSVSVLITCSTANVEKGFIFLTLLLTKQRNAWAQNSLEKLMQLISLRPRIDGLNWGEITDLHKFRSNCRVL